MIDIHSGEILCMCTDIDLSLTIQECSGKLGFYKVLEAS